MKKNQPTRELIVAEYLTGNISYRALGLKHNVPSRSICDWVRDHQGIKHTCRNNMKKKRVIKPEQVDDGLSTEVKILQAEIRKLRLQNMLLEEILKISELQTGIDLKKKFGTNQ
jgi:transposase-like protein